MTSEWENITDQIFPSSGPLNGESITEADLFPHTIFLGPYPGEITPTRSTIKLIKLLHNLECNPQINMLTSEITADGITPSKSNRTSRITYDLSGRTKRTEVYRNNELTHINDYQYDNEGKLIENTSFAYRKGEQIRHTLIKFFYIEGKPISEYSMLIRHNNTRKALYIDSENRKRLETNFYGLLNSNT